MQRTWCGVQAVLLASRDRIDVADVRMMQYDASAAVLQASLASQ